MKEKHASLLERASHLLGAYDTLNLQQLSEIVARRQVTRAREQMSGLRDQLNGLTPAGRVEVARLATLKVLANKSVIQSLANTPEPGGFKVQQQYLGAAAYRLHAHGSGSPPSITGSISAPWPLEFDVFQNVTFEMNDQPLDITVDLLPSGDSYPRGVEPATLYGTKIGPFRIYSDLAIPRPIYSRDVASGGNFGLTSTTDRLHMIVDGVAYELTLPTPCTVANAVTTINGSSPGLGDVVTASEVAGLAPFTTRLMIGYTPVTKPDRYADRHMMVIDGAENAPLGSYYVGTSLSPLGNTPGSAAHSVGWDSNNELKVKANDNPVPLAITLPSGLWNGDPSSSYSVPASDVKAAIDAAASGAFVADVTDGNIVLISSVMGEGSILTILSDGVYDATNPVGDPKPGANTASMNGALELGFFGGMEDRKSDVDSRSVLNILNKDPSFSAEAKASMGRSEILREQRVVRVPTGISDVMIQVDLADDPTASWPPVSEMKVQILNGDNAGVYSIVSVSWSAPTLTLTLDRRLRDVDTALLHQIVVYRDVLIITSLDSTTTGRLRPKDSPFSPARAVLGLPATEVESTVGQVLIEYNDAQLGWKSLDLRQRFVKIGDTLTREDTNSVVTQVSAIEDAKAGILGVSPQVPASLNLGSSEGFNLRSASYGAYYQFVSALEAWLRSLGAYNDGELRVIDKLLTPLLSVQPSPNKVNAAYSMIEGLKLKLSGSSTALLEILRSFSVPRIQQLEDALQALSEHGHDRARASLVKADIQSYLDMDQEDSSFSRAFIKAASAVVVKDVNEPTNLHRGLDVSSRERLVSHKYDDKNPLNDFSDMEDDLPDADALDFWRGLE